LFHRNIRIKKKQMFSRLKFAALLLPVLSALACAQAAPENADVNAVVQPATPTVVSVDAPETSSTTISGLTVNYDDAHMLKISARQIRLGDLLAAIGEKTGVMFDLPDSLAERPVTTETGPAILREALTTLLKKLELGYGISGDPATPETVERVVLTGMIDAGIPSGGDDANAAVTKTPEEQSDEGMTPFEVEEMLAQRAVEQNRAIEKNLAEEAAERQAEIARREPAGKPPHPAKRTPQH
jgi:hypothetical protein